MINRRQMIQVSAAGAAALAIPALAMPAMEDNADIKQEQKSDKLSTGISKLDEFLGGGISRGSVVAFCAGSQINQIYDPSLAPSHSMAHDLMLSIAARHGQDVFVVPDTKSDGTKNPDAATIKASKNLANSGMVFFMPCSLGVLISSEEDIAAREAGYNLKLRLVDVFDCVVHGVDHHTLRFVRTEIRATTYSGGMVGSVTIPIGEGDIQKLLASSMSRLNYRTMFNDAPLAGEIDGYSIIKSRHATA